jgi:hypothetical protein
MDSLSYLFCREDAERGFQSGTGIGADFTNAAG